MNLPQHHPQIFPPLKTASKYLSNNICHGYIQNKSFFRQIWKYHHLNPISPERGAIWSAPGSNVPELKIGPCQRPGLLGLLVWFSFEHFWKKWRHFHVVGKNGGHFVRQGWSEKVSKKDEICWRHHVLGLLCSLKVFFGKSIQKHKLGGVNRLQGSFCWKVTMILGFGQNLMTSSQWRQYMTSLWRHYDVMPNIFGFVVILRVHLANLPDIIPNRSFFAISWHAGHMPPPQG